MLPNFRGVLEIKHSLKGRIRFYIPVIKNNKELKSLLISQLSKIEAISSFEVNSLIGSLLINYNAKKIEPMIIIGILIRLLNLEKAIERQPESTAKKEIDNFISSLNMAIHEKSNGLIDLKTSISLILFIMGIYKMKQKSDIIPGGLTLLWWAYSNINK